jgi:uncharacterized protein HemY
VSQSLKERFPGTPTVEGGYLLAMLAVAESIGSREVDIRSSSNELTFECSYRAFSKESGSAVFEDGASNLPKEEQYLVSALRAALVSGAPRVDFEIWDGSKGMRLKLTAEAVKEESLSKPPWKDGHSGCRFVVRLRTGLSRTLFGTGKAGSPELRNLLAERGRYSGCPILYNGDKLNAPVTLGEGLLSVTFDTDVAPKLRPPTVNCQSDLQKERESSSRYYAKFLYGGESSENIIVCRGLRFEVELPLADDLGFSGIIVADHLTMDSELESLVEDTKLDDLLNAVESDLLTVAAELVEVVDELEDEAVDSVLESLDLVVETYRSSGESEEALDLLKRLVEVENIPDVVRASHLTQMARTFERAKQDETSFEYYTRALDYWGRIPTEEQNLELVATSLLGAARLMSYHDSEPETAMQYTQNALSLRRSVGEEDDLEKGESAELLARLYLKNRQYPHPEFMQVEELLQEALRSFETNYGQTHNKVAGILTELGKFCQDRGALEKAESHFLRALAIKEKLFGSRDESVGELFDRLGALFEAGGEIRKSGEYYFRALEVREHLLEPDDPEIAQRLNDLVVLYRVYGMFQKAEPLFLRLLHLDEEAEGEAAEVEASDLCSLALFYQVQSKFDKCEELYARALETVVQRHGEEAHPDTAWIHGLFGRFYDEQYLFKKAEGHLKKALDMTEAILGEDHPDLIIYLDALTRHYRLQQRYEEAMPWAERSLSIAEKFYGTQHPYLATALNSFGELLSKSGQAEGAAPIYLAAYEIHQTSQAVICAAKEVPNPEMSRLSTVRAEAERLHIEAGRLAREYTSFAEAESLYLRALFLREQSLGADHPDNARTLGLLADLYRNHRRFEGAESLYRRSFELRKKNLGPGHPDCCISLSELTQVQMLQKEFQKAKPLLEEWLAIVERTLGKNHAERAEVLVRAGQVCEALGSAKKAKALLQEAVNIRHSVFGTEHPTFAVTLAELMRIEDKPEQAVELYDFVVGCLERALGEVDPLLIPIFENYAQVLKATGDEEKAAFFETRAMVMRVEYGLDFGSVE